MNGSLAVVKGGKVVSSRVESVRVRHEDNTIQHFPDFRGEIVIKSVEHPRFRFRPDVALTAALSFALYTLLMLGLGAWVEKLIILSHMR
jgi:hypothetical protein